VRSSEARPPGIAQQAALKKQKQILPAGPEPEKRI
jgi:hypothetical protein